MSENAFGSSLTEAFSGCVFAMFAHKMPSAQLIFTCQCQLPGQAFMMYQSNFISAIPGFRAHAARDDIAARPGVSECSKCLPVAARAVLQRV